MLAGCGGGHDAPTSGGTLTRSATVPAALATTTGAANSARAAENLSNVPYCEVFREHANNSTAITGLTVDTTAKTVVFNNKVLAGSGTELGTLAGTANFQANTGTPSCGA